MSTAYPERREDLALEQQRARAAEMWDETAELYGTVIPLAEDGARRLVDRAALDSGHRVLDLGTGNGLSLVHAARRAVNGEVVGVDFSPAMLAAAERRAEAEGITNVRLEKMDVRELHFGDGEFDRVLAGSVLQFVRYSSEVLQEWARVLRPDGLLAFSVPLGSGFLELFRDLMSEFFHRLPTPSQEAWESPAAIRARGRVPDLGALCDEAGLVDVTTEDEAFEYELDDFETWWAFQWTHGFRTFLRQLPPDALEEMKQVAAGRVAQDGGAVRLAAHARFCIARKRAG